MVRLIVPLAACSLVCLVACDSKKTSSGGKSAGEHRRVDDQINEEDEPAELGPKGRGPVLLPEVGEYALVSGRGFLYAAPRKNAHRFARGRKGLTHAYAARVVKTDAEWTELELGGEGRRGALMQKLTVCSGQRPDALVDVKLRAFSRTATLLYTVRQRVHKAYADNTRFGLVPGIPLAAVRGQPGVYNAGSIAVIFTARLADAELSRSFALHDGKHDWASFDTKPPLESHARGTFVWATPGLINGLPVLIGHDFDSGSRGRQEHAWRSGDGVLVEVQGRCYKMRATVAAKSLKGQYFPDSGRMGPRRGSRIGKGTEVFWPDGTRAGVATADTDFGLPGKGLAPGCTILHLDWRIGSSSGHAKRGKPMHLCTKAGAQ